MDMETIRKQSNINELVNRHMQALDDEALSIIRDALTNHYMQFTWQELWTEVLRLRREDHHA